MVDFQQANLEDFQVLVDHIFQQNLSEKHKLHKLHQNTMCWVTLQRNYIHLISPDISYQPWIGFQINSNMWGKEQRVIYFSQFDRLSCASLHETFLGIE